MSTPAPEPNAFTTQTHWSVSLPILAMTPSTPVSRGLRAVFLARDLSAHVALEAPERYVPALALVDCLLTTALESIGELDPQDDDESGFSEAYTREFHAVSQHLNSLPLIDALQPDASRDTSRERG